MHRHSHVPVGAPPLRASCSIPYLKWRAGRPRWEPGPALRRRGFKGCDLKYPDGGWMSRADARAEAARLNQETRSEATGTQASPPGTRKLKPCQSLSAAWQDYIATPEYRGLAQRTRRDYAMKAEVFLAWAGDAPVASIRRKSVKSFWRTLHDARGHAMANGVIAVLRLTFSHAVEQEWIVANPAARLKLKTVPPRVVFWTPAECEAVLATADAMGEHGIGDAIVTALHTAQRQGDILAMPAGLIEGGMVVLKQSKRGARVAFPATGILKARLEATARRNAERLMKLNDRPLILDDRTGRRFVEDTFRHRFAVVRARAAETLPSLKAKTFQDFRDTALTRLYQAGLSLLRIAAISGHDIKTVDQVLRHYIALNADDGAAAIAAYETWMNDQGVAV